MSAQYFAVPRRYECSSCSYVGYTATPADSKTQTNRAAMGADTLVAWQYKAHVLDAVREAHCRGVPVYALETVDGAASVHEFQFPSPCGLVLGNERHGLEADVIAACTAPIRIPCYGAKNSLNVGVAFVICAFEIARQWRTLGSSVTNCTDTKEVSADCSTQANEAPDFVRQV